MKRYKLKLVLVIFTVLSLFILYLLTCFPLINTTVFRWETNRVRPESELQIPGNTNSNNSETATNIYTFDFGKPITPEISDYIIVNITAKNTGKAKYPYGSIAINLSEEKIELLNSETAPGNEADNINGGKAGGDKSADGNNSETNIAGNPGIYKIQERTRIFVDSIKHSYYIPAGENKYWRNDWNLAGPTLKGQISSLEVEIPKIEGVDIQINSVALNKRPVFAVDSNINYFFKSYFQLSYIDRYLTPAYVFLILFTVIFSLFCFLPKRIGGISKIAVVDDSEPQDLKSLEVKDRNSGLCAANANNIYSGNLNPNSKSNIGNTFKNKRSADTGTGFKTFVMLTPLILLILFSFYFISNYAFTVKGYWDSYKQYILSGRLDETYSGFSDFEKFVTWVGEKVPQGQNIIVLVKGEPIYIMAQMAYGLYPRDIKFVDISRMSAEEVSDKIKSLNCAESPGEDGADGNNIEAGKNNAENINAGLMDSGGARAYEYIVLLSETDKVFLESLKVKLEYSYRENAGFIFKLILK